MFESLLDKDEKSDIKITEMLLKIVDPLWCDFAARRAYAAIFMKQAMDYLPYAKEHINQAQIALFNIHNLMNEYPLKVDCVPGEGNINKDKFFDPSIRKEMIDIVEKCYQEELDTVAHLKNAIELL